MIFTARADEQVYNAYVASRVGALSRTAYLLTGDHGHAEDLVQTTLLKAAKAWHRIQGDPEPYVRKILHHEFISGLRKRSRRVAETALAHHDAVHQPSDPDLRVSLEQALDSLTAKQRAVVVLRFYDDLTETQTAAALGISPSTVKSTSREALAKLRATAALADLVDEGVWP